MSIRKITLASVLTASTLAFALSFAPLQQAQASEKGHQPHWGYEGEYGPKHWGAMSKENAVCSQGKTQSPIDITGASHEPLPDIGFAYKPSKLNILNNGHTVQVNYDEGSSITLDNVKYNLLQFHFHDPSEHTVGGKSFGMEVHLVHKNAKGELAVVGLLINEGKENAVLAETWKNMPAKADEKKALSSKINAQDLLPSDHSYYRYTGSLTTPPCSEGVNWLVFTTPIEMSKAQIAAFKKIINKNARPVQPINARKVRVK
ncbi:MAG: hypothetical protein A3J24_00950 [Deltaproteobacteria bacterium RIFCSPLOWO2_02_FULL_53_8]|nr:MAG: hypothetical protein A3J24_00950 [Deltaproteobacteria bacterium RIFCSPLOWO2_02_FULL_53_8]